MEKFITSIENMRPHFEKISNNPYLRAIRDGFISLIPVILFSSIFLLIAYVPNIFGFYWSAHTEAVLTKAYNYSMGILALLMSATISRSLTDTFNGQLHKTNQINTVSVMAASISSFLLLSVDSIDGGLATEFMGTKGLLSAFVVAFIVPNVYKFCVKRNITIKMPKEVPNNISQTFADLIPFASSIVFFWLFDLLFRSLLGISFSAWILELFKPLFKAADGFLGLAIIYGAMAFFWFVGIHGPSIVEPAVSAIYISNVEANLLAYQEGEHAGNVLSQGAQYFVATLGGTGATLMITFMFAFMAKSKQLKAVGRASAVPVIFGVNEPILFGGPLVLNPVFFVPFILAPIVNVWLLKIFVDFLDMNGFIYNLPWTTPGPIGLVLGTGFAPLSFILAILLLVVDLIIYYPFFKVYDRQLVEQEKQRNLEMGDTPVDSTNIHENVMKDNEMKELAKPEERISVLVLCANGATSGMLARAIKDGAIETGIDIETTAMAYGQHKDLIGDFDLIILAPQMSSMFEELEASCKKYGTIASTTSGSQYVALSQNPKDAVKFVLTQLNK